MTETQPSVVQWSEIKKMALDLIIWFAIMGMQITVNPCTKEVQLPADAKNEAQATMDCVEVQTTLMINDS